MTKAEDRLPHPCGWHCRSNYRLFKPHEGRWHGTPDGRMFICHECWQNFTKNPIEKPIIQVLTKRKYVYTYNMRHGKFRPDFTFPLLKLRIDVDGLKWHQGKPAGANTPGSREHTLSRDGWRLVHLENGPRLVRRVLKAIRTHERHLLAE